MHSLLEKVGVAPSAVKAHIGSNTNKLIINEQMQPTKIRRRKMGSGLEKSVFFAIDRLADGGVN